VEYARANADLSLVPLRSPITRGARSARCGSSSLRRSVERGGGVWNVAHMIAPHAPQYNSLFVLSLCMLHLPQAGHGGKPFSLALTRGPLRGFFLFGLNQPFLGRFTFGTVSPCGPERVPLMRLPRDANMLADAIMSGAAIASHALHSGGGRCVWTVMRS
jgi:hypothetical protein